MPKDFQGKRKKLRASELLYMPLFPVKLFPQSFFVVILPKGSISEKGFLNVQTPSKLKRRRLKRCDMHISLSLPHLPLLTHPSLSTAWFCRRMKGVGRGGDAENKTLFLCALPTWETDFYLKDPTFSADILLGHSWMLGFLFKICFDNRSYRYL